MKTRTYIASFLLFLCPFFLNAQIDKDPQRVDNPKTDVPFSILTADVAPQTSTLDGGGYRLVLPAGNIENVYFPDQWVEGTARLTDGTVLDGMLFRYNMYSQQMQFIRDGDTAAFAKPEELSLLSFGGHQFIYANFRSGDESRKGYFEVCTKESCQLLLRREITYHIVDDLEDGIINDSYILEQSYFLLKPGEPATLIHMDRKSVVSAFCDKQEEIEKYIKKNKIRFKTREDMVKVVEYYNSL